MELRSESLINFLQTKFNKKIDDITEKEFKSVESISMQGKIDENYDFGIDLNDLKEFDNLKNVYISNMHFNNSDLALLSEISIDTIEFRRCSFGESSQISVLSNIKSLKLNNCYVEEYGFLGNMKNLETLEVISPYNDVELDIGCINNGIKKLVLESCNLTNFDSLPQKENLDYLSLLWTALPENCGEYINKLPNLKQLFISKKYYTKIEKKDGLEINTDYRAFLFDDFDTEVNTSKNISKNSANIK